MMMLSYVTSIFTLPNSNCNCRYTKLALENSLCVCVIDAAPAHTQTSLNNVILTNTTTITNISNFFFLFFGLIINVLIKHARTHTHTQRSM
jgi:hypothetical protein